MCNSKRSINPLGYNYRLSVSKWHYYSLAGLTIINSLQIFISRGSIPKRSQPYRGQCCLKLMKEFLGEYSKNTLGSDRIASGRPFQTKGQDLSLKITFSY